MDETQTSDQTDQAFDAAPEAAPALPPFVTAIKPAADIRARIQEAGGLSLDRLPMLHVVFDRLATACSDAAKHLAASPTFYSLSGVESGRFGEFLDAYDANAVVGIFQAPDWDGHVLVGLDRDFIYTMVEVLFGSDGSEPPVEDERTFSAIELRIAQMVFEQVGKALESSFGLVSRTAFRLERTETRMEFAVIGRRSNKAVQAKFLLQALNRGGEMFLIIPQTVLNPLRPALGKVLTGESAARDPRWAEQIAAEVQKTTVRLRAVAGRLRPAGGGRDQSGEGGRPWAPWLTAYSSSRSSPRAPAWCRCTSSSSASTGPRPSTARRSPPPAWR